MLHPQDHWKTATHLVIDVEGCSALDLKKVGAHRWINDPSTQLICVAFAFVRRVSRETFCSPITGIVPVELLSDVDDLYDLLTYATERDIKVVAHNAAFEMQVFKRFAAFDLDPSEIIDTMAMCAYVGLPLGLDDAATAAKLPVTKDKQGHALMKRMAKPRHVLDLYDEWVDADGITHTEHSQKFRWWHIEDPLRKRRLEQYCMQDVVAETLLFWFCPDLPETETRIWQLHQRANDRGVMADLDLIDKCKDLVAAKLDDLNERMEHVTSGYVTSCTQTARLTSWLADRLRAVPQAISLAKGAIDKVEKLARKRGDIAALNAIELRKEAAKTSTAKLDAMERWASDDGRIRGMVQYYGAFRTGRSAGRGPQVQNYARPVIKNVNAAIAAIKRGVDLPTVEFFFGPVLDVVSSCLRGCLCAADQHLLVSNDLSQIEARVLPWLSGQRDILEVFRRGDDVYVYQASLVGSHSRQMGKIMVLGLGYGCGPDRFIDIAAGYGVHLTLEESGFYVRAWRQTNPRTVRLWYAYENAARHAISHPGTRVEAGYCFFQYHPENAGCHVAGRGCLVITLPSGRQLLYRDAKLTHDGITYMGVDQYTRKWTRLKTYGAKIAENVTQAVARDVLFHGMLLAERQGVNWLVSIHDEGIAEHSTSKANSVLTKTKECMETVPVWTPGLPLLSDGYVAARYRK